MKTFLKFLWPILFIISLIVFLCQNNLGEINGAYTLGGILGCIIGSTLVWSVIAGVCSAISWFKKQP